MSNENDLSVDLGRCIEHFRQQRQLSRVQFAASCGLALGEVEQIERGELPYSPTLDLLRRVCAALGLQLWELFDAAEKSEPGGPFGTRLLQLRTRRRWCLARLSEASGLDIAILEQIESEELSPDLDMLRKLARGLGLKLSELFEDGDQQP